MAGVLIAVSASQAPTRSTSRPSLRRWSRSGCYPPVPPAPDADRPSLQSILDGFRYVAGGRCCSASSWWTRTRWSSGCRARSFPRLPRALRRRRGRRSASSTRRRTPAPSLPRCVRLDDDTCGGRASASASRRRPGGSRSRLRLRRRLWFALIFLAVAGAADDISAVLRSTILLTATPDSHARPSLRDRAGAGRRRAGARQRRGRRRRFADERARLDRLGRRALHGRHRSSSLALFPPSPLRRSNPQDE